MNININQGNTQENITSEIILKLYQIVTATDNTVALSGNLYSPSGYAYQVDYLNTQFAPNFTITVPDTGKYIYFEDSAVETALMNANVSTDGIGISVQDANRATLTSSTFAGNSTITSFNGFSYFTRANTNPPNNLFQNCSSLSQIDMSNITTIAQNEFRATAIEDVNAPNLALLTGQYQFANNPNLITITNLGNITSIPQYFASYCKNLESVVLPQSCTTIVRNAFQASSALSNINLSNITDIGDAAFQSCTMLAVNISDLQNCTSIGSYVFQNTKQIVGDVSLPKLTSCGSGVFRETNGVTKVTCLGKITSIPVDLFMSPKDGRALKEVYIPYECTKISTKAFQGNSGLTTIKQYTASVDDWVEGQEPTYTDLYRITTLEKQAFSGCQSLTDIKIGNVTMVPEECFDNCSSLSSINIKLENLTDIQSGAFSGSPINWGVQRYLGQYFSKKTYTDDLDASGAGRMFIGNTFKQLYLPNLKAGYGGGNYSNYHTCMTFLGTQNSRSAPTYGLIYMRDIESLFPATFSGANITSLVINNTTVPICRNRNNLSTVSNNAEKKDMVFANFPATAKVYVPDSAVAAYKAADVWSTIASQIYPMSNLTRYATEAAWVAAGEPDTGLIEAYM